jgi:four helix bundle protein
MALGSLAEAETQLELARRLRFGDESEMAALADFTVHVRKVTHGLRRSLAQRVDMGIGDRGPGIKSS